MKPYTLYNPLDQALAANAMMRYLIGKYSKIEWVSGPPWIEMSYISVKDRSRAKRVWQQVYALGKVPQHMFPPAIYREMLELQVYVKELI